MILQLLQLLQLLQILQILQLLQLLQLLQILLSCCVAAVAAISDIVELLCCRCTMLCIEYKFFGVFSPKASFKLGKYEIKKFFEGKIHFFYQEMKIDANCRGSISYWVKKYRLKMQFWSHWVRPSTSTCSYAMFCYATWESEFGRKHLAQSRTKDLYWF